MTRRELAKELRRVHRDRYGEVAPRLEPEDAEEMIAEAESELGFPLPKLVRSVFAFAGASFVELEGAVSTYSQRFRADAGPLDEGYWPPKMLPIRTLSDHDWLCVDCGSPDGMVYVYRDDWDAGGPCWPERFEIVAGTYSEFLDGFVASGGDWPEARPDSYGGIRPDTSER